MAPYQQSVDAALKAVGSKKSGIDAAEAHKRQEQYGQNILIESKKEESKWHIFAQQWKSPLILILVIAGCISGMLGERIDMFVILLTAFLNVCIGFFQEYKANEALKKLRQLVSYKAIVLRNGEKQEVDSTHLVPGDILFLEAGAKIQADGRLIEVNSLEINEAPLTGESKPVKKKTEKITGEQRIGDRVNMAFRGTVITNGTGYMVVTAIGKDTQIGQIATLVSSTEEEQTPLQIQLGKLAKVISIIVIAISIGIFVLGSLFGGEHYTTLELFETAIAVAVAAIPEGLVISLTVILAIGMQFILKRNALVRKLVAAETLGSVSVICTDKTGTLTEGNMRATKLVLSGKTYAKTGLETEDDDDEKRFALIIGAVCSDATLQNPNEAENKWTFIGDTTEIALIYAAHKSGLPKQKLDYDHKRLAAIPFDSDKKYMATLNERRGNQTLFVKGALEKLLDKCTHYREDGKKKKLTQKQIDWFKKQEEELTGKGLRVLALAYKDTDQKGLKEKDVSELVLMGLVALSDPLRSDVIETVKTAKKAGIRIIMITGDHKRTAQAIAQELGLKASDKHVMDGNELEAIDDEAFDQAIKHVNVFARVDPKHKLRIVKVLQGHGEVVAMTGDGVNDAPAIKAADIGIAVGSGTDVAKETSDMVILDDRFPTIVKAVEEGRGIYDNIKKVVVYLLSGSFAEVVMITGSILAGLPVAALPAQILWINIVEDSFPVMALAFDKGDKENMKEPPRKKNESIIDKEMRMMIIMKSILANVLLFIIFVYMYKTTNDIKLVRTLVFVGFGIDALFYIFSIRNLRKMIWQYNPFNNKYLLGAVGIGWFMLLIAVYWAPLQILLRTVPLELSHWIMMISFGLINLVIIETVKAVFIIKAHKKVV